jgi:hypothetical protein
MSGKDSGKAPTKSDAIREVLDENPKAEAREIINTLASRGTKVNASLVYLVRGKYRKRRRRQKRQQAVETSRNAGVSNPVQLIVRVKDLAEEAGGLKNLKKLVDLLAE